MGRYFGTVGYAIAEERMTTDNPPQHTGIWEDRIVEKRYYGDVTNWTNRWASTENVNDDVALTVTISVVADAFAYQNFSRIKYVEFEGAYWKVTSIIPQRPRLILHLGGVYNGPTAN